MLSDATRWLTRGSAVLFLIVGVIFFAVPTWAADNFPWSVTPFMAMTIGGWCIGNAGIAWEAARIWRPALVYPMFVYLWLFGPLELLVVIAFRDKLLTAHILTWPYLAAIAVASVAAVVGAYEWVRRRPSIRELEVPVPSWARPVTVFFTGVFAIIAVSLYLAGPGGTIVESGFFPEKMTLFTVQAFAAFFFSLAVAVASFLLAPGFRPYLQFARVALILDIPVTVGDLINFDKFNFSAHPLQIVWFFGYITSFLAVGAVVWRFRRVSSLASAVSAASG
jgi:hypothetical protein